MTKTQPQRSAKPTANAPAGAHPKGGVARGAFAKGDVVLIVGLGNPGAKYAGNRHNIGFMALDRAASAHGTAPWRSKFQGEVSEGRIGDARVILLKPGTFMNESGRAVGEAARFLKIPPSDIIVVHDELDLLPGKVRLKMGGGHAGHNGLRSIHAHIGAEYARVRLGIGHPGDKSKVSGYVLHDFARSDRDWLDPLMDGFADGFPKLVGGDGPAFQNLIGLRMKPPKPTEKKTKPTGSKTPHQAKAVARKTENAAKRAEDIVKNAAPTNPLARLLAKFSR